MSTTHHERNSGAKLYCGATWCSADNPLCKGKDIGVCLYAFFDLVDGTDKLA